MVPTFTKAAAHRMLRTLGAFEPLRRQFDLGVGYGAVTVNRHRRELFVLGGSGVPILAAPRTLCDEDEVLGALKRAARFVRPSTPRGLV